MEIELETERRRMEGRDEMREEESREKMKASLEAFYNNQIKRDAELLTIPR